ncbi:MAG: SDR family oxidoreductase [Chloroflexota bacterium]|nr:SDR family oxidoreductase [Chloroflexota bacterium]
MKITIFGATGRTGVQLVIKALDLGHEVTAVARYPENLKIRHERLKTMRGDVLGESPSLETALVDQDAVLSALGAPISLSKPVTLYSRGTQNIIMAMYQQGVKRLVGISSIGIDLQTDPNIPAVLQRVVMPLIFRNTATDMRLMEERITHSEMEWTIVRAPRLSTELPTGRYRVAEGISLHKGFKISRADLADFMVKQLSDEQYLRKRVSIAY